MYGHTEYKTPEGKRRIVAEEYSGQMEEAAAPVKNGHIGIPCNGGRTAISVS